MKVPLHPRVDARPDTRPRRFRGTSLEAFRAILLDWYRPRARPLRIRSTRDPWSILVAEVMAQQTQIARVDEAWATFLVRYPTPADLAAAPMAEVLRAWAGLGYNRRAVALQRAAVAIEREHGGRVPAEVERLAMLPGVGPYTARAVAAVAFGQPVAAVDTNVRRVISRLIGRSLPPRELQALADTLVPADDPVSWTHATMDLGATICRSRRPRCDACPVRDWCRSADRPAAQAVRPASGTTKVPFEQTSRWLRGRIVARLREAEPGTWVQLAAPIGPHGPAAVAKALEGLGRDGLLEQGPDGSVRLPSGPP